LVEELSATVGLLAACRELGIARAMIYRRRTPQQAERPLVLVRSLPGLFGPKKESGFSNCCKAHASSTTEVPSRSVEMS
jgi:hypothetical protein